MLPRFFPEGADESGISSAPFGIRGCATPFLGTSASHASSFLSRRCRRKWRFIVTFWHSRLCDPVLRHFSQPCFLVSFQKVTTKAAFHRHLLAFAAVLPHLQALQTAKPPRPLPEGADESGISSAPSSQRDRVIHSGSSARHLPNCFADSI